MCRRALARCGPATTLAVVPGSAQASDFSILVVFFAAVGISGILIAQALIGVFFVVNRRYTTRPPTLFVTLAGVLMLAGVVIVLGEARHLSTEDLAGMLATILVPGAIAVVPALVQHAWFSSGSRM